MSYLVEWERPFLRWADERERDTDLAPAPRQLQDIEDMALWLSHRSNWKNTQLFCMGWGTRGMWIGRDHVRRIAPGHPDRETLLTVLWRWLERRNRPVETIDSPSHPSVDEV